ncbi:hypothetical protein MBT84_05245 [Streptomyces sp. MBT84]|nr:hypothetical protein [Streptomyces sp. MBT84]
MTNRIARTARGDRLVGRSGGPVRVRPFTGRAGFDMLRPGYPHPVTTTSQQEVYRFLEDRFACAQSCTQCARVCALRASLAEPDGTHDQELLRRKGIMCAEVCDATCRVLSEQERQDENAVRGQVEWCRLACLECAHVFDMDPGGAEAARACRACARACSDFLRTLN